MTKTFRRFFFLGLFLTSWTVVNSATIQVSEPVRRLILIGGGDRPKEAMKKFVEWSGGKTARIAVFPWGTVDPEGAFHEIKVEVESFSQNATVKTAPVPKEFSQLESNEIERLLTESTGVYFPGGDQVLIMEKMFRIPKVLESLRKRYSEGLVIAGSSAGTAIMSATMLTGNGNFDYVAPKIVETSQGLGLLTNVIVDQHFMRRKRQNRLMSVLLSSKETVGIGIDEDTAVGIENEVFGEVLGPNPVMKFVRTRETTRFAVEIQFPGARFAIP